MRDDDLYKRGKIWWGRWTDSDGFRRRSSLKTKDKKVAAKRLRELELAGQADRPQDRTLGEALAYLIDVVYAGRPEGTISSYRQKARHLVRLLGRDAGVSSITRSIAQEYRAARLAEGASHHSINKEGFVLRRALRECDIEGVVPAWPAKYKPVERHLTPDQFRELLGHLPAKRRLWIMVACFLGARDSEILRLEWPDVDLKNGRVRLRGSKTKRSDRVVPIHDYLRPWLAATKADREQATGKPAAGRVVASWGNRRRDMTAAYWKVVGFEPPKDWMKGTAAGGGSIAGAPRLSPNDLRRTFASWLKQAGVDSAAVAGLLGHSSPRMVDEVYGRLSLKTFEDAVAQLPGGGGGELDDELIEQLEGDWLS